MVDGLTKNVAAAMTAHAAPMANLTHQLKSFMSTYVEFNGWATSISVACLIWTEYFQQEYPDEPLNRQNGIPIISLTRYRELKLATVAKMYILI